MNVNLNAWWKASKNIITLFFAFVSTGFCFWTWDDLCINSLCSKVMILIIIIVLSVVIALICVIGKKSICVWKNGNGKIKIIYGDLLKLGFPKSKCNDMKKVVVIPVNTAFDTILDEHIAQIPNPIVSENSIHGQWLKKMYEKNYDQKYIEEYIFNYLDRMGIHYDTMTKSRGSIRNYKKGTCALVELEHENTIFLLLATSEFDEYNNVIPSRNRDEFINSIKALIIFIDKHCQGYKCFIPLMGTSLSREGLSHKESLHYIISSLELYNEYIHGTLNVVIRDKDKDKVSIFDN